MRITLTFDERKPQERALMHQYAKLSQPTAPRPTSSTFPFSWLELGVHGGLRLLEAGVQRLVWALFPHKATQRR